MFGKNFKAMLDRLSSVLLGQLSTKSRIYHLCMIILFLSQFIYSVYIEMVIQSFRLYLYVQVFCISELYLRNYWDTWPSPPATTCPFFHWNCRSSLSILSLSKTSSCYKKLFDSTAQKKMLVSSQL